jgi:hypothetical protein
LRKVSVGILTLAGAAVLLISFLSANLGYTGSYDIGPAKIGEIAQWRAEVAVAMRAIRGTSAAYAAAFAALFLSIVLGPYRRGEVWAWWRSSGRWRCWWRSSRSASRCWAPRPAWGRP